MSLLLSPSKNIPIVVDGVISSASAELIIKLNLSVKDYNFPTHLSVEHGQKVLFELIETTPLFDFKNSV